MRADSRLHHVPIVVLTGEAGDADEAYGSGANAVMVRPESLDGFFDAMRAIQRFWLEAAVLPPQLTAIPPTAAANFRGGGVPDDARPRPHRGAAATRRVLLARPRVSQPGGRHEQLGELFGLHPLAVEDSIKFGQRPKVEDYGNQVLVVF